MSGHADIIANKLYYCVRMGQLEALETENFHIARVP